MAMLDTAALGTKAVATYHGDVYHIKPLGGSSHPRRSKGLAYLLWLTLGYTGAHRFYLKRARSGAMMTLLFLVGFACYWLARAELSVMASPSFVNGDVRLLIGTLDLGLMIRAFGLWAILSLWLLMDAFMISVME